MDKIYIKNDKRVIKNVLKGILNTSLLQAHSGKMLNVSMVIDTKSKHMRIFLTYGDILIYQVEIVALYCFDEWEIIRVDGYITLSLINEINGRLANYKIVED